jgi:hypothetical protein
MSDEALGSALVGSPMKRAKAAGLRRNIDAAAANADARRPSDHPEAGGPGKERS